MKRSARRQCRCDRTTVRVSRRIWNRALSGSVTTGVRSLVIVVALLVAGCSTGSHIASGRPDGAPTRPTAGLRPTLPAAPHRSSAPLSARIVLPARTMTAGSSMSVRIVVENNTGRSIHASGCLTLFQVALVNSRYRPSVAWFTCAQAFTIPIGESSYSTRVQASYSACSPGRPQGAVRACLPDRQPPPLPPGDYRAMLFQVGHLVPVPPAMTVRVTPPESAP